MSPPVPSEMYERRPCLCMFVARFDRRIFLPISQTPIRVGSTYAECNSGSLKQHVILARPHHCLPAMPGTIYPGATQYIQCSWPNNTLCALIWTAAGMQAVRRPGRSQEGWRVGRRKQGEDGEGERDRGEGGRKR